jgi:hypothetical protein
MRWYIPGERQHFPDLANWWARQSLPKDGPMKLFHGLFFMLWWIQPITMRLVKETRKVTRAFIIFWLV